MESKVKPKENIDRGRQAVDVLLILLIAAAAVLMFLGISAAAGAQDRSPIGYRVEIPVQDPPKAGFAVSREYRVVNGVATLVGESSGPVTGIPQEIGGCPNGVGRYGIQTHWCLVHEGVCGGTGSHTFNWMYDFCPEPLGLPVSSYFSSVYGNGWWIRMNKKIPTLVVESHLLRTQAEWIWHQPIAEGGHSVSAASMIRAIGAQGSGSYWYYTTAPDHSFLETTLRSSECGLGL